MIRLDAHIEALLETYNTHEMVNHSGDVDLPSRVSVEQILAGLDELLFPGFRENSGLYENNLRLITSEKVYGIARKLIRKIEKSLAFSTHLGVLSCEYYDCHASAEHIVEGFFQELPELRRILSQDLQAAYRGDPSAKQVEEIILSYPGFQATVIYRLAHFFWEAKVPFIPRMMSEVAHSRTGIYIHPGAKIGESFFIDHGTGVVIGETAIIGKNVKIYQGVTLGALSVKKEEGNRKRHPTIEDDVTIYAGATILGGETVIGKGSTISGNVWITESVAAGSKVQPE